MAETQDEQETVGGHHMTEDGGRWRQGGAGGGARGLGGVDRINNGGHKVETGYQGAVEGEGASSSEKGMEQGLGARQGV